MLPVTYIPDTGSESSGREDGISGLFMKTSFTYVSILFSEPGPKVNRKDKINAFQHVLTEFKSQIILFKKSRFNVNPTYSNNNACD